MESLLGKTLKVGKPAKLDGSSRGCPKDQRIAEFKSRSSQLTRRDPVKRSSTKTIITALEVLSREVQSDDGIANAAIVEAAARMMELRQLLREASGPISYGHWSSEFREKVKRAVGP